MSKQGKPKHRFPIGTQYYARGKRRDLCTVVDQLTTTNRNGDIVNMEYICEHLFLGQVIRHVEIDTTIARGLLPEWLYLLDEKR